MAVKTITFWSSLIRLAHREGQARLHGTVEEYERAAAEHEAYRQAVLRSDGMVIDVSEPIW